MKIATYNVNGIRARLPVLLRWLSEEQPEVACLQELKAPQEEFPLAAIQELGYEALWHGQKSWNGVAILSRVGRPEETARMLPGDDADLQSRILDARVGGLRVICLYLPNGNPAPGPKFDYKLTWMQRLEDYVSGLADAAEPTLITGDFNIIPTEKDVYRPERWTEDALFRPESRAVFARLQNEGWTDALRHLHPEETIYTYWDYFRNAFGRNAGLRIDHFLLNKTMLPRLQEGGVALNVRGWEKSSDHAPVWIILD